MASTTPATSMNTGSAVAAGATVDFLAAKRSVSAVIIPSANLLEGVVTVEASMDDTNWVILRTVDVTGRNNYAVNHSGVAFRYWRASIIRAVSGGTVRVIFMEAD